MPKDITEAACDEDEGADGEGVADDQPGQLRRRGDGKGLAYLGEEDEGAEKGGLWGRCVLVGAVRYLGEAGRVDAG